MTQLLSLSIQNLRNIREAQMHFSKHCNYIVGANGAGKTSLLEAISLLAHGRSFRTLKIKTVLHHDTDELVVRGSLQRFRKNDDQYHAHRLGVMKRRNGQTLIRLDGEDVSSISELAVLLPLLTLDTNAYSVVAGSPSSRRKLFNWLMFHVKHEFRYMWQSLNQLLRQRNVLLKHAGRLDYSALEPWDLEIARVSAALILLKERVFESYVTELQTLFDQFLDQESFLDAVSVSFSHGWGSSFQPPDPLLHENQATEAIVAQIADIQRKNFDRDRYQGYTSHGCHKSDILLREGTSLVSDVFSRGQNKILSVFLHLAAALVLVQESNELEQVNPVILFDDLPAELDKDNLRRLAQWLNKVKLQSFITAVQPQDLDVFMQVNSVSADVESKLFHVKHGEIAETDLFDNSVSTVEKVNE